MTTVLSCKLTVHLSYAMYLIYESFHESNIMLNMDNKMRKKKQTKKLLLLLE